MHTKTLLFSLLLIASPFSMADSFYEPSSENNAHHEATIGGVGLVAGSLIAGPFGAIIGGSLGVMTGHQQSQSETITEQQHFITELEQDLNIVNSDLLQSKNHIKQLESTEKQLQKQYNTAQTNYKTQVKQFISSYQFDVYFLTNSNGIQTHAQQGLFKLADLLKNNPRVQANIEAHSDWRGNEDINYNLAQKRLDSITNKLVLTGVNNSQLLATNYGEQANNNSGSWGEELFYDRRVTITLNLY
jgi:outer membrane protein OmpA-like peptidoglycan-associated protein